MRRHGLGVGVVVAVLGFATGSEVRAADSTDAISSGGRYPDRTAVLIGAGAGLVHVGLADENRPREVFGTKLRVGFDLGYEVRPWLELGAALAFGELGESDSLGAVLRQRGVERPSAAFTLVLAGVNVRARWIPASGRWTPYARAGVGVAGLSLSAPEGLGRRRVDPAWDAGGGIEFYAHSRLVLRAEALYIGQETADGARHHASIGMTLLYAVPRAALAARQ